MDWSSPSLAAILGSYTWLIRPAAQAVYTLFCIVPIYAIWSLQRYEHRDAKPCIWYAYSVFTVGLIYEVAETWYYGPPDFPASRWLLVPSMAVVLVGSALKRWHGRREERKDYEQKSILRQRS